MKKRIEIELLFSLLCAFFVLFSSAQAIPVTVATYQIPDIQFPGTTCSLRFYASNDWTDSAGTRHLRGDVGSQNFFQKITGSVSGNICTLPSFVLQSTEDAIINNNVRLTAVLYDGNNGFKANYLESFYVPSSLGASITWTQIQVANRTAPRPPTPTFYSTSDQINAQIAQQIQNVSAADATTTLSGKVKLTTAPSVLTNPVAVSATDTAYLAVKQIKYASDYANLSQAAAAIGTTAATTLTVNSAITANAATFAKNINLKIADGGTLLIPNGVTLKIQGNIEASPNQQIFSTTGTGKVDLYDSTVTEIYPEWWGAKVNDSVDDLAAFQAAVNSVQRLQNSFYAGGGGISRKIQMQSGHYKWSGTLIVNAQIHLTGVLGDPYGKGTWIDMSTYAGGMQINYVSNADPGYLPDDSLFENFVLNGQVRDTIFRIENSGMRINARTIINNVTARHFEGHGFSQEGYGAPTAVTNLWRMTNCATYSNNGSGLYVVGNDSSAGVSIGFSGIDNRRAAIEDASFLGNTHIAPHARGNLVAPYITTGAVADNTFIGPYAEADQPASQLNAGTVVIGGVLESGISGRAFQIRSSGSGSNTASFRPFAVEQKYQGGTSRFLLGNNDDSSPAGAGMLFGWSSPQVDPGDASGGTAFRFGVSQQQPNFYALTTGGGSQLLTFSGYKYANDLYAGSPAVTHQLGFPDGFFVGGGYAGRGLTGSFSRLTETSLGNLNLKGTVSVNLDTPLAQVGSDTIATLTAAQTLTNKTLTAPTISGISVAPTASAGTNTTQLATTAFVQTQLAANILTGTASLDFPSTAAAGQSVLTITVAGAATGDACLATPNGLAETGLIWNCAITSANTASVRISNITAAAIDPAARSYKITLFK